MPAQRTPPAARLLDITRLLRRAGRVWTGVDRVELAYLDAIVADPLPAWGLARTPFGYVLLDETGLLAIQQRLVGAVEYSSPDFLSRMQRGRHETALRAQTDARKHAAARCLPSGLARMLRRMLPERTAYLNTGHSNLSQRVLSAVRSLPHSRIAVFVHDIIPLEYPQFQGTGTVDIFRQKMQRVAGFADLILYNSADTQARAETAMALWGSVPHGIVAHLGAIPPEASRNAVPDDLSTDAPYFITVGTIEPRKNHTLLLDIWEELGPDAPLLLICGNRGWNNEAIFARLDSLSSDARVREMSGLDDKTLMALVGGAQALLFPSHAEGFGLPAVEALQLGTPVICSNMATFREILGKYATYADISDVNLWKDAIVGLSEQPRDVSRVRGFEAPTWDEHFKIALSFT